MESIRGGTESLRTSGSAGESGVLSRELALKILSLARKKSTNLEVEISRCFRNRLLPPYQRGMIVELVKGVTKSRETLEWILNQFSTTRVDLLPARIRLILFLGIYQVLYLSSVPFQRSIFLTVELAKRYGHPGTVRLVNALLRKVADRKDSLPWPSREDPARYLSVVHSHPLWLVEKWIRDFGVEEAEKLLSVNNEIFPLTVRVNTLKIAPPSFREACQKGGAQALPGDLAEEAVILGGQGGVEDLPGYQEGWFQVQSEPAMLVSYLLSPEAGDQVLDLCSAPGGKTTHLAQIMRNKGLILSVDKSEKRLNMVKDVCRRLGVTMADFLAMDGVEVGTGYPSWAHRALVDAPCSSTGVLMRKADARWQKSPEDLVALPHVQLRLLESAAQALASGGVLVYSTCSLEHEENQGVVRKFLSSHPEFLPEHYASALPQKALDFLSSRSCKASGRQRHGYPVLPESLQFFPHHHRKEGHFMVRLRKRIS